MVKTPAKNLFDNPSAMNAQFGGGVNSYISAHYEPVKSVLTAFGISTSYILFFDYNATVFLHYK